MPNFQVPQFIDQQAKIFGPLTLHQFLYVAAAAALSLVCFYVFSFILWLMITFVLAVVAITLAFVKINGQEMPKIVGSSLNYILKPRTYTWQRKTASKTYDIGEVENIRQGMGLQEKLKSIALNISTGKFFSPKQWRSVEEKTEYKTVTFITGEHHQAKKINY